MTDLPQFCSAFGIEEAAARRTIDRDGDDSAHAAPWYVQVILGIGAWITGVAIILFVAALLFLGFDYDEPDGGTAAIGAVLFIAGLILGMRRRPFGFMAQFYCALAAAGLFIAAASIGLEQRSLAAGAAVATIGALVVIVASRDPLLQFLASGLAVWLGIASALDGEVPYLIDLLAVGLPIGTLLYLHPPRRDLRATATVLLLLMPALAIADDMWLLDDGLSDSWPARAITLVVLCGLIWLHGRRLPASKRVIAIVALAILAGAVGLLLPPGASAALAIMMLAFVLGSLPLAITGTLIEIVFLWRFYYDLDATLLTKSLWLMGVGAALLAAYVLLLSSDRWEPRT
jgi:uncharacterized membrane protein